MTTIRFRIYLIGFLFVLVSLMSYASFTRAAPDHDSFWEDEFDALTLNPVWYWVNEDPSLWSLSENPGSMRIFASSLVVGGKNLLLRTPPPGKDFEVKTFVAFTPTENYQIAGIVLWQDSQNRLVLGRAFCTPSSICVGNGIYFDNVENGVRVGSNHATVTTTMGQAYLRMDVDDRLVSGYYSEDGTTWLPIGTHTVGSSFSFQGIGITAAQDLSGLTPIPADFDYFKMEYDAPKVLMPVILK